jgi:hypothetical protein
LSEIARWRGSMISGGQPVLVMVATHNARMAQRVPDAWDAVRADPAELRLDVDAIAEAVRAALLESLPRDSIRAIWFTGSAAKDWTSPVDYVPELSDVDVHVWLAEGRDDARRALNDLASALRRHEIMERMFRELRPAPSHTPRVQVVLHNELLALDDYLPAPRSVVRTLHGEEYRFARPKEVANACVVDARALIANGDEGVLQAAIFDLVARPGRHFFHLVRTLSWRVSPLASRVLMVRGVAYERAWGSNRTACLHQLEEVGETELCAEFISYYTSAWDSYADDWENSSANRQTFAAAVRALRRGRAIGEEVERTGD